MSDILIKNMKMPTSCEKCGLCDIVCCNSYRFCSLDFYRETRAPDCPLVEVPSADIEEVERGRWIKTVGENGATSACRCSNCGFGDNRYSLFKYCPVCGERMDGGT